MAAGKNARDGIEARPEIKQEKEGLTGSQLSFETFLNYSDDQRPGKQRASESAFNSKQYEMQNMLGNLSFLFPITGEKRADYYTLLNPYKQNEKPQATKDNPHEIKFNGPFADISPALASVWLNTKSGKDLAPIAEKFEADALQNLSPEAKPNIYVSKEANDKALPANAESYRSINEAIKHAKAGSVIQVLPGVYNEKINLGAGQSDLTIQTDRRHPAVINGGGFRIGSGAHDIMIRNFEVKNFSGRDAGIKIDGSNIKNITIAGNNVHDAKNSEGISIYGRPGEPVSGISIIGNRIHDLKLGELEALPVNGNVDGFKIIGNSGYRLNNLFIDLIGGEGNGGNKDQARNGIIAYNFADGISSRRNPSYNEYSAGGIYVDGGKNLDIYGNYVRSSDFGIEVGSEHRGLNASGINVHNNIFEKSNLNWLKLGYKGGVDNTRVKDNLILGNETGDIEREGPVAPSTRVENNISSRDRNHVSKIPALIASKIINATEERSANKSEGTNQVKDHSEQ